MGKRTAVNSSLSSSDGACSLETAGKYEKWRTFGSNSMARRGIRASPEMPMLLATFVPKRAPRTREKLVAKFRSLRAHPSIEGLVGACNFRILLRGCLEFIDDAIKYCCKKFNVSPTVPERPNAPPSGTSQDILWGRFGIEFETCV